MKKSGMIVGLIFLILAMSLPAWAEKASFLGDPIEILPLKDVKPGMVFYALSDCGESKGVQKFYVEVVTINYDAQVNGFIIWFKPHGKKNILDRVGVVAGMSGSPMYLEDKRGDKLVGALAYGFNFQPPIPPLGVKGGIKPIEEMLKLQESITAYYGQLPEMINQLSPNPKAIKAGEAIAGVILAGDIPVAATGTVTLSTPKGFLAFGHPFMRTGYSNIPVYKVEIGTIMSTILGSFKWRKEIIEPQVGTIIVDSFSGILGLWHDKNTMVPVNIKFKKLHLNRYKTEREWRIDLAPRTPLSKVALEYVLQNSIILSSPDLNKILFNVQVDLSYKEQGTTKKLSVFKRFFCKNGSEISSGFSAIGNIYYLLEKSGKQVVKIDAEISASHEKEDIIVIGLEKKGIEIKNTAEPGKEIKLGLTLNDKDRNYKKVIKLKGLDSEGKLEIRIQDKTTRLASLIREALENKDKIKEVLDFVESSGDKNNVIYIETTYIKSLIQNQKYDNSDWTITSKKAEKQINTEVIEVKLPDIKNEFELSVSAQEKVAIEKKKEEKQSSEGDKTKKEDKK